ncbi:hypothetical protein B0T16DRAFT_448628 [Cercophora newfieldiana]|uniref:BTB domain-containing protein n=1 Tax=Cercophora newfieldiana TaxID=92897 RepID=A0AA39XX97_9PEZI|nr:hypothetical protein B0T16DRAFT_448628 [Cercophora newfieldiana]
MKFAWKRSRKTAHWEHCHASCILNQIISRYANLTLTSGSAKILVDKNIICSQSKFLDKKCSESPSTTEIELELDTPWLVRIVQYFYTGSYTTSCIRGDKLSGYPNIYPLYTHAKMYVVGRELGVEELKGYAKDKYKGLLAQVDLWDLLDVVYLLYDVIPSRWVHRLQTALVSEIRTRVDRCLRDGCDADVICQYMAAVHKKLPLHCDFVEDVMAVCPDIFGLGDGAGNRPEKELEGDLMEGSDRDWKGYGPWLPCRDPSKGRCG